MDPLQKKSIETFRSGLNCAQSVLTAFSRDLDLDNDLALSVAAGFGAGMGRLQETCGAVTGAFMVFGIYNGKKYNDTLSRKERTYSMIQDFNRKFTEIHGTTSCRKILGCDLKTDEGRKYARDNKLFELICEKCVSDSVKITEQLISEE